MPTAAGTALATGGVISQVVAQEKEPGGAQVTKIHPRGIRQGFLPAILIVICAGLDAVGPDELRIPKLIDRIVSESVTEVILALGATIDGQTTAHYIADQISDITVTSLAQGVPVGGELDYLDDGTITAALNARKAL